MGISKRKSTIIFLAITIICVTIIIVTLNPRMKTFNFSIQYKNIRINTEAQYETPKEKATDVQSTNDLSIPE